MSNRIKNLQLYCLFCHVPYSQCFPNGMHAYNVLALLRLSYCTSGCSNICCNLKYGKLVYLWVNAYYIQKDMECHQHWKMVLCPLYIVINQDIYSLLAFERWIWTGFMVANTDFIYIFFNQQGYAFHVLWCLSFKVFEYIEPSTLIITILDYIFNNISDDFMCI